MTVVSLKKPTTRPPDLVLTKAEILAAIAPIQSLATRISETHATFETWHETLPADADGDTIGYVEENDRVKIVDADLDLYDEINHLRTNPYPHGSNALSVIWEAIYGDAAIEYAIAERDRAERAEKLAQRGKRAANTRTLKAEAKWHADRAKDQRIAELEAQLKTPHLVSVNIPDDE
jgi:hypothetical protein